MKVVMAPRSLERGADTCRSIAGDVDELGGKVGSLPHPEGMPGDAVAELAAIVAALGRSSRAATAQGRWLDHRARLGFFADGPFGGGLFDFGAPPLLSPWDMPAPPPTKKPKKSGWDKFWGDVGDVASVPVDFQIGVAEGLYGLGKGAVETVAVGGAHFIDDKTRLPISDHIPWVGGLRRDFDAGIEWARKHPKEFAALMKDDLIAADEDNAAQRAGKITVEIAGLAVSVTKIAKLGKLAKLGKVPETKKPDAPGPDSPKPRSGDAPSPNYEPKIEKQMTKRGWDEARVDNALSDPARVVETRDTRHNSDGTKMNDPATAYYSKDGGYVVINDRTGDVVQVSDVNKPGWKAPWD